MRPTMLFLLSLWFAACAGNGCNGCSTTPLPGGALPADQTIEGGGQLRVSASGLGKFSALVQGVLLDALGGGFCTPAGYVDGGTGTEATWCGTSPGGACTGQGCDVDVSVSEFGISAVNESTMNLSMRLSLATVVHIDYSIFFIESDCDLRINANNMLIDANMNLGIDPTSGELTLALGGINQTDFSDVDFDNCGILDEIGDLLITLLDSFVGDLLIDVLTPTLSDLVAGLLPDPLGLEGVFDVGGALNTVATGADGGLEAKLVPGGYANLIGGGLSLGLITGFNADEDPATRTPELDNEPDLCVPPFAAPNFAAAPASLPLTSRGTYALAPAGVFTGAPEVGRDLGIGLSETMLDLIGHHIVASGALCLSVGADSLGPLNLATLSLLLPSVAELLSDNGSDPLMLAFRPQRPLRMEVGDGASEPNVVLFLDDMEIDFYGFLYERYTRLFTASLTLRLGLRLAVDTSTTPAQLIPMIDDIGTNDISVDILNAEFVRETEAQLEGSLPALLANLLPSIAGAIGGFALPEFGGFALGNPSISEVTTPEDSFLGIFADLVPGVQLRAAAQAKPGSHLAAWVQSFAPVVADPAVGSAAITRVTMPSIEALRRAVWQGGALPSVQLALSTTDAKGRLLEWSWRLDHEMWRPFVRGPVVTLSDRSFLSQGERTLGLRARVIGDNASLGSELRLPLVMRARPEAQLATDDTTGETSGGCNSSATGALGLVAVMLGLMRKRRSRGTRASLRGHTAPVVIVAMIATVATLSACGDDLGWVCEAGPECTCEAGFVGQCIDGVCSCLAINQAGKIGAYSDIAASPDGNTAWVSGYASYYGDLVVAQVSGPGRVANEQWEWVDGVPDVAPTVPGSPIRRGIEAPGDDAGRYTSIAVAADGTPMVASHAPSSGALRFAAKQSGAWTTYTVDDGTDIDGGIAGRYTAIATGPSGRVGIAYLVHSAGTAEIRFAEATGVPLSKDAWTISVVENAPLPPPVDGDLTVPTGPGLFIDLAFDPNGQPVIAHYDREHGDLRLVRRDGMGVFTATVIAGLDDDAGWSPSIALSAGGVAHVAYMNVSHADLMLRDTSTPTAELVDDGYRIVGQTEDGLPKPEFHQVGYDASLLLAGDQPAILYQDATSHELLLAERAGNTWTRTTLAGNESPAVGAYGFFASASQGAAARWFSSWVIDLPTETTWVEIFAPSIPQ